jgi:hypothetical protein
MMLSMTSLWKQSEASAGKRFIAVVVAVITATGAIPSGAQSIAVPNFSFESPPTPFVNISLGSWQKNSEPAFYGPAFGGYGIPWNGTAGVFLDVNPYQNHDGMQAGYMLAVPQVALFQDYNSSPTHEFDATFDVGKAYQLTIGVFGKSSLAQGSMLELSLYYRDGFENKVSVGSTVVTYSAESFPTASPLNFIDFSVNIPTVQATDPWAGQHIGIQLESAIPIEATSFGNWDFDNVRLSVVPEPASMGLLTLGFCGLFLVRVRRGLSS